MRQILILASLFVLTGCWLEEQKPKVVFQNGNLPQAIAQIANPTLSPELQSALIAGSNSTLLDVAVIDLGVDYLHPSLRNQIKVNHDAGFVTGIGFDIMGQDEFAHPNLISSKNFAFGAQKIEGGIIYGALEDPMAELSKLNKIFMEMLIEAIAKHEVLKSSLFARIHAKSMNVLGAYQLVYRQGSQFSAASYKDTVDSGRIFGSTIRPNQLDPKTDSYLFPSQKRALYDYPWVISTYNYLPDLPNTLFFLEHGDVFNDVLLKVYGEFVKQSGFELKLQTYFDYQWSRAVIPRESDRRSAEVSGYWGDLAKSFFQYEYHWSEQIWLKRIMRDICVEALPDSVYSAVQATNENEAKAQLVKSYVASLDALRTPLVQFVAQNPDLVKPSEASELKRAALVSGSKNDQVMQIFFELVGEKALSCVTLDPAEYLPQYIKDYNANYRGAYVAGSSVTATHGTHVAGIIAQQDPKIGIVPVRVTTQYVELPVKRVQELKQNFKVMMKDWVSDPIVQAKMKLVFKSTIPSDFLSSAEFAESFVQFWDERIEDSLSVQAGTTTYQFVEELIEAMNKVGEQKIKIANISLGTSFATVPQTLSSDPETELDRSFDFLKYEVFKYTIAKVMIGQASGTLFVIAAGNDGKWVDGETRVALPCDVSSPYFETTEVLLGAKLLNNKVNNILCVGSVSSQSKISSFSNITLTNVPFVFSYGEAIQSALRLGDCEGTKARFQGRAGSYIPFPRLEKGDLTNQFLDLVKYVQQSVFYRSERHEEFNSNFERVIESMFGATAETFCYASQRELFAQSNTGALSGTSMATPAVAGVIARDLIANIQADFDSQNISWDESSKADLYVNPKFAPTVLIQSLKETSQKFGGTGLIKDTSVVTNVRGWDDGLGAIAATTKSDLKLSFAGR